MKPAMLVAALLATGLLTVNQLHWRGGDLRRLHASRRYWEDLTIATTGFYDAGGPRFSIQSLDGNQLRHALRRYVLRTTSGMPAWPFWRTIPVKPFLRAPRIEPRDTDDTGRSLLLGIGFRLLGGVAPRLQLWLGPLLAIPLLLWLTWELADAGRRVAMFAAPLLYASSAYLVACASLPYSALGFYLLAILALEAFAVHALLNPSPSVAGLALRTAVAGCVLAACIRCRSSALFLLPGYLLALAGGLGRRVPGTTARLLIGPALAGLLLAPVLATRAKQHHEVWLGLWEGLGDFDHSKGHAWNDALAKQFLRDHGVDAPPGDAIWFRDNEAFFRRQVLTDVGGDPLWYLAILFRRAVAALTQARLWTPYLTAPAASEEVIRTYYTMAPDAEQLGVGRWSLRVPMPLLIAASVAAAWRPRSRPRFAPEAGVLVCGLTATLGLPIAFTTASGLETQGVALVYLLGLALAAERCFASRPSVSR